MSQSLTGDAAIVEASVSARKRAQALAADAGGTIPDSARCALNAADGIRRRYRNGGANPPSVLDVVQAYEKVAPEKHSVTPVDAIAEAAKRHDALIAKAKADGAEEERAAMIADLNRAISAVVAKMSQSADAEERATLRGGASALRAAVRRLEGGKHVEAFRR